MAKSNTVEVVFTGDTTGFQRAAATIETRTDSFGKKMGTVFGAIGGVAAAKGVFDFAKNSIDAFKNTEEAAAKLDDAFARFPKLSDTNANALRKLNTQLESKTKFDDEATASGQAVLAQFGLTGKQITQLTPLLQDYAAKTGKDLPEAADLLGKALLGKGRALAEIGIKFKDTGSVAGNFTEIMGGLTDKVGGFATREGKTAAGQAAILRNQFGELEEKVGSKLLPVLQKLTAAGLAIVDWFQNLSPAVQTVIEIVGGLLVTVFAITKAVKAWTAVQAALNVVMDANPLVLIGLAIAALVAGIIIAYQHSETFRTIVQGAFHAVGEAAGFMKDLVVGAFQWIVDKWLAAAEWITRAAAAAFGWVPGIGQHLKDAAKDVEAFRDSVNASLDGIRDKKVSVDVVMKIPSHAGTAIPSFAEGGVMPGPIGAPGLAILHGGETVTPPGDGPGLYVAPGAIVINTTGGVSIEDGNRIIDAIVRASNRGYKLPARTVT